MKLTSFLLILLLLILLPAAMVQAQSASPCQKSVMVWDNDTLTSIAQKNNVQMADLAAKNGLALNARLLIGDVLCLDGVATVQPAPIGGGALPPAATTPAQVTATVTPSAQSTTATPSTTATTATVTATATTNVGQGGATQSPTVVAPAPAANFLRGQTTIPNGYSTYTVQPNDNLFRISLTQGVPMTEVARINNIANLNVVYVGETLLLPPPSLAPVTVTPVTTATPVASATAATATPTPVPNTGTGGQAPVTGVFVPLVDTIPVLTLQPTTAKSGSTVTVTGSNYPGNATVNLYIEKKSVGLISDVLATVTTAPNGTFTTTVTIPNTWKDGSPVNQTTVSISAYTTTGGYWAMNFFVNR